MRRRRGFSLMEAIISLTLFSFVFLALANLQQSAGRALEIIEAGSASSDLRNRGFRQFSADCAHFVNPGILPPGTPVMDLSSTIGSSSSAKVSWFTIEQSAGGAQGLRKVTYELVNKQLMRTSEEPAGFPENKEVGPKRVTVAADGVNGLQIQYWDGKGFFEDWVGSGHKGVPQGVHFIMDVGPGRPLRFLKLFNGGYI